MAATTRLRVLAPQQDEALAPAAVARRVALVCTPFHAIELPSLALGTLGALLRQQGHHVDVVHLNLDFAEKVGIDEYDDLMSYAAWLRLLGEWLFADQQIAPGSATVLEYRRYLESHRWRDRAAHLERFDLSRLKAEADRAVERWLSSREWGGYDVVGFNVMFQQLNASLRLGSRIKQAWPGVHVIFGGSAMEVPMGQPVLDRHTWLDAVFSGYSEHTLPEYVATLPPRSPRVITQSRHVEMDALPVPEYEAFFADVRRRGLDRASAFNVPIETSRGCWWGERQHCIFCGLNALDMKQRNKSAARVIREVSEQSRYRRPFFATDNILPLEFLDELFDELVAKGLPFNTFYETKSNLRLADLAKLRRAGVSSIQPGIESLSTPVLTLMKKGVTAAQNLWMLRAAEELELGVAWSILYGFPGEHPAEYERIAGLLPLLSHLPPPLRPAPVLLERYSPLFDDARAWNLENVRPTIAHRAALGDAPALEQRAYVFDFDYGDGRDPESYTAAMNQGVGRWIEARRRLFSPRCEMFRIGNLRVAFDSRSRHRVGRGWPRLHVLNDAEWELVSLTNELFTDARLRERWTRNEALEPLLDLFERRGWIVRLDGRIVRVLMVRDKPFMGAELERAARAGLARADRMQKRLRVKARRRFIR